MNCIADNISQIKNTISSINPSAQLVAVTKNFPVEKINEAIACGVTHIGENRVQELLSKYDGINNRKNIKIHLIGHLQSNKIKYIIDIVDYIDSVDSISLARKIDTLCQKKNTSVNVLVQLNMGSEENKFGIEPEQAESFLREIAELKNIKVCGLMGVLPKTDDEETLKKYFLRLNNIFLDIRGKNIDNINMDILSMGMSHDYKIALSCGSNMIRVGSAIFGERKYL